MMERCGNVVSTVFCVIAAANSGKSMIPSDDTDVFDISGRDGVPYAEGADGCDNAEQ